MASLRIDLDRLNTFGDEVFGDPAVLRSYYFSISNVAVGGRCKCNGHASKCIEGVTSGGKKRPQCKCEHNTDGEDCQKCLPLYNDTPWKRATRRSGNACSCKSYKSYREGPEKASLMKASTARKQKYT